MCGREFDKILINHNRLGCPHCIAEVDRTAHLQKAKARKVA